VLPSEPTDVNDDVESLPDTFGLASFVLEQNKVTCHVMVSIGLTVLSESYQTA